MSCRSSSFRPCLLALAIALGTASSLSTAASEPGAAAARDYDLPAAPMATTLTRIAADAGLVLSIDPKLVRSRNAAPVRGHFDASSALREALRGSGLELIDNGATYSLRAASGEAAVQLPDVSVVARQSQETAWGPASGYLAQRSASGSKTDTPLLETPRSISVVTREQLEDRNVHTLDDAIRYTPGAIASSYGSDARSEWIRLRGFVPTQFLDGLPLPKGNFANPKAETWNLERVTVLRGPASSLYGQTPPGGLIDMLSLRPEAESAHELEAQLGRNNHRQINFDSTGPLVDEQLLYRVSGVIRDSGSVVDHADNKRYNIAPSLTWLANEDTTLTLLGHFTRDDLGMNGQFLPHQGTAIASPTGRISRHKNLGDPDFEFYDRTYYALGYALEHRIDDVWQFRQNLRYTKSELDLAAVTPFFVSDPAVGTLERIAQLTEEDLSQFAVDNNLQADFTTGAVRHTVLIGLDHQRWNNRYDAPWAFGAGVPTSNVVTPVRGQDFSQAVYAFSYGNYQQKLRSTGLYLQDQMALDNWRLTLGARQDWTHLSTRFRSQNDATSTHRDAAVTGNLSLSYVFDSGLVPYVSYAESFQPTPGTTATEAFKPTEGEQYELGVKYQPPGRDMLISAAVYDLTQQNVSATEGLVSRQIGEIRVRGFELEATANLSAELKLVAAYSYTDAKIVNGDDDGNRLQLVPYNQASLWADYTWQNGALNGFGVGTGVRYVGSTYGANNNVAISRVGSYAVYDAAVHYELGKLVPELGGASVALNVTNLFDKQYYSTCDALWCYFGDERNVTASVNYKW